MIGIDLPVPARTLFRIALWWIAWPFLAVLGAGLCGAAAFDFVRYLLRLRWVRAQALVCPAGDAVSARGRWKCAACGGVFAGWVGARCPTCGDDSADWTVCHCGLAVVFPWRDPG